MWTPTGDFASEFTGERPVILRKEEDTMIQNTMITHHLGITPVDTSCIDLTSFSFRATRAVK